MRVLVVDDHPLRIVVLATLAGDVLAARALKAGAHGYVLKERVRDDLPDIIRAVHSGRKHIEPVIALQIADSANEPTLTSREIEILQLISSGNSNKRIAKTLTIGEETVKSHVRNIITKLDVHDRTHAMTVAVRRGIIQL